MYGERRGPSTPPIQVGDEIDVTIEAVGEKGDGLAKINGFVLFIPGVKEGQHVKVRVTKVLRKVGFAEVTGEGAPQEAASAEAVSEEAPMEPEAPAEDSETFGEEAPVEATEEATEEVTEEAPESPAEEILEEEPAEPEAPKEEKQ